MRYSRRIHSSASADRLEKLIAERLQINSDVTQIDERIWELFGETWAIMFTDLSGFSRRINEFGIIHFLQTIYESHRILVPKIDDYNGILLKVEGDSLLVLFKQPQRAVECAIAMQKSLQSYNQNRTAQEQVLLCVGLGYGRILKIGDEDVFGLEVNAASKLGEDTAKAYEILLTDAVKNAVDLDNVDFESLPVPTLGLTPAWKLHYGLSHSARATEPPPNP